MKREEIIRMAEECGIPEFENNESQADNIIRFAALVAAAKEAELNDGLTIAFMHGYEKGKDAGAAAEREAALDLVDDYAKDNTDLRDAIRARGQS